MRGRTRFIVEWIDTETLRRKAERAIMKASRAQVERGGAPLDVAREMAMGVADWADPESACMQRAFPSLAMAKGWAVKNRRRDFFHEPQVFVLRFVPTDPWPLEETEIVEEWRFDGTDKLVLQAEVAA